MGAEATCAVTVGGKTATATARLEAMVLQVRGRDLKLDVPISTMKKVVARDGVLSIEHAGSRVQLALGASADKWAHKILHPPSRLAKLGVKPDWHTAIVGTIDGDFVEELRAAVAKLSVGRVIKDADAIFLVVSRHSDFDRLALAKSSIKPTGAVWLIRVKGSADVTERAVMAAGKAAGLVDVKVVGFSSTHNAVKFVIPVKDRAR